jgi:cell wall-associated NlpC family hydrolase
VEGIALPRDSDQQAACGTGVAYADRQAGDLVFFPGHVGLLLAGDQLCHANAHWMAVVVEPLADVIGRLGDASTVTAVRRVGR